jgi:uncharacterized protein (TIGR03083 family)
MRPLAPTFTAHLYEGLHARLMELLRGLSPDDWQRPTVCREWLVRDIAAHILDTQTRTLSFGRDKLTLPPGPAPANYSELVAMLNGMNADWVRVMRRMSPALLVEFLAITGPQQAAYVMSLDPDAPAAFPVAWAGDTVSPNWFHIGRDYTEYWHHQQQIRDAVKAEPITGREWLGAALDIFIRALPVTYRNVPALPGRSVSVVIDGDAGSSWVLAVEDSRWRLFTGHAAEPSAIVTLSADTAWRIFTKGLPREEASRRVRIEGDAQLGAVFLDTLAIMA